MLNSPMLGISKSLYQEMDERFDNAHIVLGRLETSFGTPGSRLLLKCPGEPDMRARLVELHLGISLYSGCKGKDNIPAGLLQGNGWLYVNIILAKLNTASRIPDMDKTHAGRAACCNVVTTAAVFQTVCRSLVWDRQTRPEYVGAYNGEPNG